MKSVRWTGLLSVVLLLAAVWCQPSANAQELETEDGVVFYPLAPRGAPLPAGATLLRWSAYQKLVVAGRAQQLAPQILDAQQAAKAATDAANQNFVGNFLDLHPELDTLAQLVAAEPTPNAAVQPYGTNWLLTLDSGDQVVTLGDSFKFGSLANSIRSSGDRTTQLNLYTSWYQQLPAAIVDPATGAALPTPSSLADASLEDIQGSLATLANNWSLISNLMPPGPGLSFVSCPLEVGASPVKGDRSFTLAFSPVDPFGIFAQFNFPNKPYLTCVKNQVRRGLCHTFATISGAEMLIARKHAMAVNLSEQDEMEHLRLLWHPTDYYDDGDSPTTEINAVISHNYFFAYEKSWDYNPSFSRIMLSNGFFLHSCDAPYPSLEPCSDTSPQAPLVCAVQGQWQYCSFVDAGIPSGPYTITSGGISFWNSANPDLSVNYILLNLAFNNAVLWSFGVTDAFQKAGKDGIVPFTAADIQTYDGGHVVHIVGYVSNDDLAHKLPFTAPGSGGGYFIVKNSWGTSWGDGGYGYVPVNYVKMRTWETVAISGVN